MPKLIGCSTGNSGKEAALHHSLCTVQTWLQVYCFCALQQRRLPRWCTPVAAACRRMAKSYSHKQKAECAYTFMHIHR